MRKNAITKSVDMLTKCILSAASGTVMGGYSSRMKMAGPRKLMIPDEILKSCIYERSPYESGRTKAFPDIIPEVIERLREIFPDVDFRQDEVGTYLLVDWS